VGSNRSDADLIAFHADPEDVVALLGPGARLRVWVTADPRVDIAACDPLGPDPDRVVTFPVDGPRAAVDLAIAGLFAAGLAGVAAASDPRGAPPEWWVLDVLGRYATPAVDLRGVSWLGDDGIWWTHPTGPVRLPLVVTSRAGSANAARVLQIAEGVGPSDPASAWLEAAAQGGTPPGPELWSALLCARYLTAARHHVTQRAGRSA
jgi:hypothetical protein